MRNIAKNILLVIFLLALLMGSIYEYFHLKKTEVPVSMAITAIPIDASYIMECRRVFPLWKSVSQTNLIWQDLTGTESADKLNHNLLFLDTLLGDNDNIHGVLENAPLFISAHQNGLHDFDYLFICSVPGAGMQSSLLSFIASQGNTSIIQYEGTNVYTLTYKGGERLTYSISHDGIFICSLQSALVKESLRQLQSHISLMNNRYFTKVLATSGNRVIANLFINFQALDNVVAPFLNKAVNSSLPSFTNFAQWLELDITLTPNEVMMNGFGDCDSTGSQFLGLFAKQLSRKIEISAVAPSNTAFMSVMELRDYGEFNKQYKKYMELHHWLYKQSEWEEKEKKTYGITVGDYFSWINNEMALVITEPTDSTLRNDVYAVLGTGNPKGAISALDSLGDTIAHADKTNPFETKFMEHTIRSIDIDNVLPDVLGETFKMLSKAYYSSLGNYVVFANSPEALQIFINQYEEGNSLDKDKYYKSFVKDHVEDEAGIYIYNNIALSPILYQKYLDREYALAVKKHKDICKNFQALAVQMSYMQGMFYTNIYFKRNPRFKKEAGALWQVALDTTVASAPCWVTDYKTKNKFVFVQDKANNVYLISNTGKILWKRAADGKLVSGVNEIDVLKNEKTQYLFNTKKTLYILDRNGNNVDGYPVKFTSQATGPVNLFDYDGDKNYRILVPCADKIIREYDVSGKQVEGWARPETKEVVNCSIKHINIDGRDYIVTIDNMGKVYLYDRKGEVRIRLHHALPSGISRFYIVPGDKKDNTFIYASDSSGSVSRLSLSDIVMHARYLADSVNNTEFVPADLKGDNRIAMLFMSSGEVFVYDSVKSLLFHCTGKDSLSVLQTYTYTGGKIRIGAVDNKDNKIYLWDNTGGLCTGFPLYGAVGFNISDMNNDGQKYLVTGSKDNSIYVYSLP